MSGMPPYDAIAAELRLIAQHEGPGVWRDRSRLTGLLLDQQPELRREIRAVVTAVEQGVAQSLAGSEPSLTAITIDRQASLLESEANLRADIAQSVTRAIAHALNLGPLPSIYGGVTQAAPGAMPMARPPAGYARPPAPTPAPVQVAWDGSHGRGGHGPAQQPQPHPNQPAPGYPHGASGYGAPDQWGSQTRPAGGNRNLILGLGGGAIAIAGIVLAVTLGGGGGSGGGAPSGSTDVLSEAYLEGRWCDSVNSWMTFESASKQINLPNGNTGQRVVATYALSGTTLTITGTNGSVQNATVTRIDQQQMDMLFPNMSAERVRRC